MKHAMETQCRRCGQVHEEVWQLAGPDGSWAMTTAQCECGHSWTTIYTAPGNLAALRAWLARGCEPAEGPAMAVRNATWRTYRLEGVSPALVAVAS